MSISWTVDNAAESSSRQDQQRAMILDDTDDDVVVVVRMTPSNNGAEHPQAPNVFRNNTQDNTDLLVLRPPDEIVRSNSITSAITYETAMFLDAQSQEEEILKAELKNLEQEFREQTDQLMTTESRVRELRDQLLQVQHERDGIMELHEICQGEMDALRSQCETVIGLDISLKAAISEIDRLRKLQFLEKQSEQGKEVEECHFKIKALNHQVEQLTNELEQERLDKERIRIEMENELQTIMEKLSEEMKALFEQQVSEANLEIQNLRKRLENEEAERDCATTTKLRSEQLQTELFQMQFEFNQVQESLEGTRAENDRIRKEASETIDRLTGELSKLVDERNALAMDLSTSNDEQNRLRFSIKEDGKVPREEVSKAVAHAVESRDHQIKELRQQIILVTSEAKKAVDERNWLIARLKVSKEEASLLQRQVVEQQQSSALELRDAHVATNNAMAETNRLRQKLDVVYCENQNMKDQLEQLRVSVDSLRQLETQSGVKISYLEHSLSETEDKLLACKGERDLLREQLAEAKSAFSVLSQEIVSGQLQPDLVSAKCDVAFNSTIGACGDEELDVANEESLDIPMAESFIVNSHKTVLKQEMNPSDMKGQTQGDESGQESNLHVEELCDGRENNVHEDFGVITGSIQNCASSGEEFSIQDSKSVDTQKASGSTSMRTLDSFEGHVHVWPRTWNDNDGQTKYGGRDLVGYGAKSPKPLWPNMAKVALNIVIHFDEGGEWSCMQTECATREAQMTEAYDMRSFESILDYGSRAGFWRLHRLLKAKHLPCTVFAAGVALQQNPEACRAMKESGWEVASNGYRLIDYLNADEEAQIEHMKRSIAMHKKVTGDAPAGIYVGNPSSKTRRIVSRCFYYDSDSYSDDLPYWTMEDGKPHLVIPHTLTLNDIRFNMTNGFSTGQDFAEFLIDSLDKLLAEGRAGSPKMMSVGLHCHIIGRPGRAAGLSLFLDHVKGLGSEVWVCTREDIARFWYDKFYPKGQGNPVGAKKAR